MTCQRLFVVLLISVGATTSSAPAEEKPRERADQIHSVYGSDSNDAWNRIFRALFTRSIDARLATELDSSEPAATVELDAAFEVSVSQRTFERVEFGDRAIEPFYDGRRLFFHAAAAVEDPLFTELRTALELALAETATRPARARLIMQSDVWAAFDRIHEWKPRRTATDNSKIERREQLLSLCARLVRKLALTEDEIERISANYPDDGTLDGLPDLFGPHSTWIEVQWQPDLTHESAVHHRRVARLFLKALSRPDDPALFLRRFVTLPLNDKPQALEAAALVIQNLAVSREMRVVATNLTFDVQVRQFVRSPGNAIESVRVSQHELSRRELLSVVGSSGLHPLRGDDPAYLAFSGNDFSFASPVDRGPPILASLARRCESCHGVPALTLLSFGFEFEPGRSPPVIQLDRSKKSRSRSVAKRKVARDDWKDLLRLATP